MRDCLQHTQSILSTPSTLLRCCCYRAYKAERDRFAAAPENQYVNKDTQSDLVYCCDIQGRICVFQEKIMWICKVLLTFKIEVQS